MKEYEQFEASDLQKRLDEELAQLDGEDQNERARLLHELSVYQIELEMQNRELREAQAELEQTRDRYIHLYELAPVGYVTLDRDGLVQQINIAAAKMLDATPSAVIGRPLSLFVAVEDTTLYMQHLKRAFAGDANVVDELRLRPFGGQPITVHAESIAAGGDHADECRMALIDISEQKRAEAEARQNREALLRAGRLSLLGELSSGIAHEISQPIAAISAYAQALRNTVHSQPGSESELLDIAGKIAAQSERAGVTLDRVRAFARREAPRKSQEDIVEVVREAVGLVEPTLKDNDVVLDIQRGDTLLDPEIDRVQVIQVLVNLLQNAIQAMGEPPAHERRITVEVIMPDRDHIEIAVKDTGAGIDPDIRENLFMPFYTSRSQGLGLGLSLSHAIVQAHGGRIWAEANSAQGSVFHFALPIAKRSNSDQ